jgi:hypothetical protein
MTLKKLVAENTKTLSLLLDGQVVPIPKGSCDCGKPIVFPRGRKTYECHRCGGKWKLVVTIAQIKKPTA